MIYGSYTKLQNVLYWTSEIYSLTLKSVCKVCNVIAHDRERVKF